MIAIQHMAQHMAQYRMDLSQLPVTPRSSFKFLIIEKPDFYYQTSLDSCRILYSCLFSSNIYGILELRDYTSDLIFPFKI